MGDEFTLLPETLPTDAEDVAWGLQTAAALWGRGESREALVWLRRAAESAGAVGHDERAVMLAKRAVELEQLFQLGNPANAPAVEAPPAPAQMVSFVEGQPTAPPPAAGPPPVPSAPPPGSSAPLPPPTLSVPPAPLAVSKPPPPAPIMIDDLLEEETTDRAVTLVGPGDRAGSGESPPPSVAAHPVSVPAPLPSTAPRPSETLPGLSGAPLPGPPPPPRSTSQVMSAVAHPAPPSRSPAIHNLPAIHSLPTASSQIMAAVGAPASAAPASFAPASVTPASVTPASVTPAPGTAEQRRRQRAPILDPWSDELPGEDAPRTVGHRADSLADDDSVVTSAPLIDAMLRRKAAPPPPPPMKRSPTLTGANLGLPQPSAVPPEGPDSGRLQLPTIPDEGHRPPLPTRRATLTPRPAGAGEPSERRSVPPPPPPAVSERRSMPPPAAEAPPVSRRSVPPPAPPPAPTERSLPPVHDEPGPATLPARGSSPEFAKASPVVGPTSAPPVVAPPSPGASPEATPTPSAPAPSAAPSTRPPPAVVATAPAPSAAPSAPPPPAAPSAPPPAAPPAAPSAPPPAAPSAPPPAAPSAPPPAAPSAPPPASVPPAARSIGGISLERVPGFADLPGDVQKRVCEAAELVELGVEEETNSFAIALLLSGQAFVCASIADVPAEALQVAGFASGLTTRPDVPSIRVVAGAPSTMAVWQEAQLTDLLQDCPWVLNEFRLAGDRHAAAAGSTMGPLGDLDEASRFAILQKLVVKALKPGQTFLKSGDDLPGLTIVGAGGLLHQLDGGEHEFAPGDVVLAESALEGGEVDRPLVAGEGGAILLTTNRMNTLELFSTVPTLVELLRS